MPFQFFTPNMFKQVVTQLGSRAMAVMPTSLLSVHQEVVVKISIGLFESKIQRHRSCRIGEGWGYLIRMFAASEGIYRKGVESHEKMSIQHSGQQ